MKMKRFLCTVMTVVLTASLIGCNVGNKPGTDPATDPLPEPDVQPIENQAQNTVSDPFPDAEIIIFDTFEDGEGFEWGTYSNGGTFTLACENGEMVADISKVGNLDYSCQISRDGFELNQDAVYGISFDIRCDIERAMQWRFQLNGGDYHAYYMEDNVPIGPEAQTISATFTMEEATDPAPRFCFNLGIFDGMDADAAHKVYIDNFKFVLVDGSNAKEAEGLAKAVTLKVNQVGYKPDDVKKVVATIHDPVESFNICDAATGEVVYTGKFATDYVMSTNGDGRTFTGDFSDFDTEGEYYISADGIEDNSYNFTIGKNVFDDVAKSTVRMLYLQRCGCELDKELAGKFAHKECHTGKAKIYGTEDYIDVSGGWHDAGDYGRYIVAGAKTVADLFLTYEDSSRSRGDDYDIPESGNGIPDILDEARYELDFMLKMQAANGGVYHKVTCAVFPGTVMPEEETDELIVCPISTAATGDFAAVMAKASVIYKDIDADFASECLEASKKAYAYLEANAGADKTGFINPSDISTGEYPDDHISDEYLWAAVELYLVTGDASYQDKIIDLIKTTFRAGLGWADMGHYAMYDYLKAKGIYGAGDAVRVKNEETNVNESDEDFIRRTFTEKMTSFAEDALEKSQSDPYFSCMRVYPWGSNMTIANTGILYRMMYNMTGDEIYDQYARHQIDYLLGINPTGYCYVTSAGTLSPEHPHHRPSQFVGEVMPGMLVGGPNSEPADPYASIVLKDKINGSCYVDNDTAYSINEITIYWNSPLIYLLQVYR